MPADLYFIRYHMDRLLPGQRMLIKEGFVLYEPRDRGVTRKGVEWVNSHIEHRENCTVCIQERADKWLIGKGVDIGCGIEKIKEDCIGIDSAHDYTDRTDADDIRDASDLTGYEDGRFDWVFSSNCLEHIENWEQALDEWIRVLKKGGIIFLYLPWPAVCRALSCEFNPGHVWNPSPFIMKRELEKRGIEIIELDEEADEWGCFITIGRKA